MRRPPPLTQFARHPVTAGVALMAIAVTLLVKGGRSLDPLTMNVLAFEGQPWRIVTSALPHADAVHLLFNVMWLWIFGTAIEAVWGSVRTFAIFVLFATGSTLAEYALFAGGIGLSGVGYGLCGLLAVLARRDRRFADTVDRRTIELFVGWFFLCILLTVSHVMAIGNVAHGSGAVLGLLLGLTLTARRRIARIGAAAGIVALLASALAGATTYRPIVNLSSRGGADSARIAYDLLESDDAEAVRHLRRALEISPGMPDAWHNLGLGLDRLGDEDGAVEAYRHALQLENNDEQKGALAGALEGAGLKHENAGDHARAIELYRESVQLDPTDPTTWHNLGLSLQRVGDDDGGIDAYRHAFQLDHSDVRKRALAHAIEGAAINRAKIRDEARAIDLYRESVELDPTEPTAWFDLSLAYDRVGKRTEALEAARRAAVLDRSPDYREWVERLEQRAE
jgi:Flp pilus assembly protein TadD/membrane associated rhomboid family serine protease